MAYEKMMVNEKILRQVMPPRRSLLDDEKEDIPMEKPKVTIDPNKGHDVQNLQDEEERNNPAVLQPYLR